MTTPEAMAATWPTLDAKPITFQALKGNPSSRSVLWVDNGWK
jgi:hypothetical protein